MTKVKDATPKLWKRDRLSQTCNSMDNAIDWIVKCDRTWRLEIAIVNAEFLLRFIQLQPPKSPFWGTLSD
jgi:hypothetical protein